jgi:hypothetical protein
MIGLWVGPRVGLDAVEKIISLAPVRNQTQAVQPVAILGTYNINNLIVLNVLRAQNASTTL